jgi:hypothetical protein
MIISAKQTFILVLLALVAMAACAHKPAPAQSEAPKPAKDRAPGAQPHERSRLIEAEWTDAIAKARKEGSGVVAAVKLVEPKIRIFHAAPEEAESDSSKKPSKPATAQSDEVIDLAQELRAITPLDVNHVDVLDGQVAFIDTSRRERPEIWLHDLQLSVENLTTRVPLTEGRPVLLTASGILANSGTVSIFITADPFEKGLTFSGRASIVGLQTADLYKFIQPATGLQAPRGTVDLFVEFDCRNGELTGGIKPILKNVEIRPDNKKLVTILKAWVTDVAVKFFSDRVTDRNAVVTVIPIKGTLTGPDVQLWPTIFAVLRNAFVEGLTSGYAHLPPVTNDKKEGVVKQGVDALTGSAPPKAQPTTNADPAPAPTTSSPAVTSP